MVYVTSWANLRIIYNSCYKTRMITQNIYYDILLVCGILIISYSFNWISKITKVPSVLLLILLGVGCQYALKEFNIALGSRMFIIFQLLGIAGLIMIVLEAALDLKLTKDKNRLIIKALFVAFITIVTTCISLSFIIRYFLKYDFYISLIYAIPLSIMSSAVIIPAVNRLSDRKREFMIYESTFSDILGIMMFYFTVGANEKATPGLIAGEVVLNIGITTGISILISYFLILIFQKFKKSVRLFLLISILVALYTIGKIFDFYSLIVILVFGLVLNNYKVFFSGKLKKLIDHTILTKINEEFHLITRESAFIVRTFYFVVFGITLNLISILNPDTAIISLSLVGAIYVIRFICLRPSSSSIFPELFIAPRGLITVLLFFVIPEKYMQNTFNSGILLYIILFTGLVMAVGMAFYKNEPEDVAELHFDDLTELDKEVKKND